MCVIRCIVISLRTSSYSSTRNVCTFYPNHVLASREQNYTLKVQFSTFHWSVKPLWFSSFKCSAATLLGVWKSARCTLPRAVHLKLENQSGFALAALLHLRTFALFAHHHLRWMCTSAASFGCALLANSHFHALCTFAKLSCLHFCALLRFVRFAHSHFLEFVRLCTLATSCGCAAVQIHTFTCCALLHSF